MQHILEDPSFWYLISFILFFVLLGRPIGKAFIALLDEKRAEIQKELAEADHLYQQAQELLLKNQAYQRATEQKIEQILVYAEEEIERLRLQTRDDFEEFVRAQEFQLNGRIKNLEHAISNEMAARLINTAVSTAKSLIVHNMTEGLSEKLANTVAAQAAAQQ